MAGLEPLQSLIYHEKQAQGSMLCAQHALNSLLQGNYFTAPDLSAIARTLDALEQSYDDNNGGTSTNMDDTGFFSVQVLENALQVWGLTLHRWRSEGMRPYHNRPHTQLGFILNLHQHWFTLRRFGAASPNPDSDQGQGHWFNLNSFLEGPEWVGKLYLSMVLEQAEQEGYSVFVVMQLDITAPLALLRTEADELALQLPEPSSSGLQTSRGSTSRQSAATNIGDFGEDVELQAALQDMDLQAALQASLMAWGGDNSASPAHFVSHSKSGLDSPLPLPVPPPLIPGTSRTWTQIASGSRTPTQPRSAVVDEALEESGGDSGAVSPAREDPVAESVARNRSIMERMRQQQEMAFRDSYQEIDMEQVARRRREEEEEEEMLRRVIAESQALHQQQQGREGMDTEDDTGPEPLHVPMQTRFHPDRVYDDEDTELQAALRASLEDTPEGYQMADSQSPRMIPPPLAHSDPVADLEQAPAMLEDSSSQETDTTDPEIASETSSIASPEEVISVEEMRRRRLAKFGTS